MAKYAFIHIPKNAGTSFRSAIEDVPKIDYFYHDVKKDEIKKHKKIFICRNPIDRFTSSFFFLKHWGHNSENNFFNTPEELLDALKNLDPRALLFMKVYEDNQLVYGHEIITDWVFHPQSSWIFDPWRVLIYDRLDDEIEKLNNILKINLKLDILNKSEKCEFQYSEDSINLLKIIYKKDFDLYAHYNKP